ncbi:SCO2400 family protein [Streptomyces sp. DW26H14]|uniref:SCO2400 family protein n=1 Tax=Streptomyces sp. DW26H14 TaxID=3435395 RepID=UPI00403D800D
MDYCDRCRRHLNGALACAGCGTPAEDLRRSPRPGPAPGPAAPPPHLQEQPVREPVQGPAEPAPDPEWEPAPAPEWEAVPDPGWEPPPDPEREHAGEEPVREPGAAVPQEAAPGTRAPEHAHRRAGRRPRSTPRRARSKRGRRALIGVLGVVLAAGALSLAQLALDPAGTGAGGTVTDNSTGLDYDGDPGASGTPALPGAAVDGTGGGRPGQTATGGTPGASPSASGDAASPDPGGSRGAASSGASPSSGTTGGAGGTSPTRGAGGADPTASSPTGPGAPPASTPATPPGGPGPEPSKSHCTPVLLWCM